MKASEHLVLVGTSHRTATVAQRERLSLEVSRTAEFYSGLQTLPQVDESFVLSTCNRLEVYATVRGADAIEAVTRYLCDFNQIDRDEFEQIRQSQSDIDAVLHLFDVAAGIDSQIVGETEILGQVKDAYNLAIDQGAVGSTLNRLIQRSFQAAKWIRTHTALGEGQISTATVAVDLAIKIFGRLDRTRVLVIGAGEIGEKTVRALRSRGARTVTVTSRTEAAAEALAAKVGADAAPIDVVDHDLGTYDIVVSSTSSPDPVLTYARVESALKRRDRRPLFLIDLAVPRDIEPGTSGLDNVYLYNIDDLSEIASENLTQRKAEVARCRAILKERAGRAWSSIHGSTGGDAATRAQLSVRPSS